MLNDHEHSAALLYFLMKYPADNQVTYYQRE
jgi:hypothetical protein